MVPTPTKKAPLPTGIVMVAVIIAGLGLATYAGKKL